ncbi:MAG: hypothetical protein JWM87_1710 [Candidatus Eremiobacteraeota bacterium]|nr:hypothetical protein [Candidatus Eremiobacteraeota bacterium]
MPISPDRIIPLREALRHLHAVDTSLSDRDRNPFFFIVGSGISVPAIPTSSEIVRDCRAMLGDLDEPLALTAAQKYSYWFSKAYPQPVDRQRYLESLIRRAKATPAVLALAHLLIEGRLAKLVITPNFDDLLARALLLFGARPLISDHPYTVGRVDPESPEIQIVHVHGSYYYYDLANLDAEIYDRRTTKIGAPVAIPELLGRVLWDRSPIVIGYAGWPGDVIMTALERRLRSVLNRNLYWFCYNENDIAMLPDWLTGNSNVLFVVAEKALREPAPHTAPDGKRAPVDKGDNPEPSVLGRSDPISLPADRVLTDLISKLKLRAPALTVSPINFFYEQVSSAVEGAIGVNDTRGGYYLSEVLDRIRHARDLEQQHGERATEEFGRFLDAVRRASQDQVAELGASLLPHPLSIVQLREVANALRVAAGSTQISEPSRTLALLSLDKTLERIADEGRSDTDRKSWLRERLTIADQLYTLGRIDEELRIYDDTIRRCSATKDPALMACVILATQYKANTFANKRREYSEALQLIADVLQTYAGECSIDVRDALADSEFAAALIRRSRGDDTTGELREIATKYKNAESPAQVRMAALALNILAEEAYSHEGIEGEFPLREELEELTRTRPTLKHERVDNLREMIASSSLSDQNEQANRLAKVALSVLADADDARSQLQRAQVLRWKFSAESDPHDYEGTLAELLAINSDDVQGVAALQRLVLRRLVERYRAENRADKVDAFVQSLGSARAIATAQQAISALRREANTKSVRNVSPKPSRRRPTPQSK